MIFFFINNIDGEYKVEWYIKIWINVVDPSCQTLLRSEIINKHKAARKPLQSPLRILFDS